MKRGRKGSVGIIISVIIILILIAGGIWWYEMHKPSIPAPATQSALKTFSDDELGLTFSYQSALGDVEQSTTANIDYGVVNLQHQFSFTNASSVSMAIYYLGPSNENYEGNYDYKSTYPTSSQTFCDYGPSDFTYDNQTSSLPHSAFRENGGTDYYGGAIGNNSSLNESDGYIYGTCEGNIVSYVHAEKLAVGGDVPLDAPQETNPIDVSKTYIIKTGNQYYSFLSLTVQLPTIMSGDYCILEPGDGYKTFDCITYPEKAEIENEVNSFATSSLASEIDQIIASISVTNVAPSDATAMAENYFIPQTSYQNPTLGVAFNYPSILPAPTSSNGTINISTDSGSQINLLNIYSRQDAADEENLAAQCQGECYGPAITTAQWDRDLQILNQGTFSTTTCDDCIGIQTLGANTYLVLNTYSGKMGFATNEYVTYHNNIRYEFNVPINDDLVTDVVKKIIASASFGG
jgi:hypothetical protein